MFFVEGKIGTSNGIGKDDLDKVFCRSWWLGLSLVGGTGVVFGLADPGVCPWWGSVLLPFTWRCLTLERLRLQSAEGVFIFSSLFIGVGLVWPHV